MVPVICKFLVLSSPVVPSVLIFNLLNPMAGCDIQSSNHKVYRRFFSIGACTWLVLLLVCLSILQVATCYLFYLIIVNLVIQSGDSWSHSCTNRVILYWNGDERYAYIEKSPSLRCASAPFSITGKGIRNSVSNCKRIKMM